MYEVALFIGSVAISIIVDEIRVYRGIKKNRGVKK